MNCFEDVQICSMRCTTKVWGIGWFVLRVCDLTYH